MESDSFLLTALAEVASITVLVTDDQTPHAPHDEDQRNEWMQARNQREYDGHDKEVGECTTYGVHESISDA